MNPDGTFRYLSPAAEWMTGYFGADAKCSSPLAYIHPEDIETVAAAMTKACEKEFASVTTEFRIRNAEGQWLHCECVTNNLMHDPRVNGLVVNVRDVTQRKKMEAEREQLIAEREQLIAEWESANAKLRTLTGMLPICASCKMIRDDEGRWHAVEVYVRERSDADFTHGICPQCTTKLYPEYEPEKYD
jgi:PAS domain S-box-containing protein